MNAITKYIIPIFSGIGAILFVLTLVDFEDKICINCWPVEYFLYFTYFLLLITVVATLGGAIAGLIANPASIKKSLGGVGFLLLAVIIGYALASDEILPKYGDISASTVRWSGAGLYVLYIMVIGAVGAILFSAISNILKR